MLELPEVATPRLLLLFVVPPSLLLMSGAKDGMQAHSTPTAFSAKCQKSTPEEYHVRSPNHKRGLLLAKSTTMAGLSQLNAPKVMDGGEQECRLVY